MEIGEHCSYVNCSRLDFLPFTCDQCHRIFCKDHHLPDQHSCAVSSHFTTSDLNLDHKTSPERIHHPCSKPGCKKKELVVISCPWCEDVFCLQHRHQVDHSCSTLMASSPEKQKDCASVGNKRSYGGVESVSPKSGHNQADQAVRVSTSLATGRGLKVGQSGKARRMEAKVCLMKLKMKAEGATCIPQVERVYYLVRLPEEAASPDKAMYFSKEWSVGKVVDYVAQKHKLTNENNFLHSQRKLQLHGVNGEPIEMARTLNSLLENFPNGATVLLKYVCTG